MIYNIKIIDIIYPIINKRSIKNKLILQTEKSFARCNGHVVRLLFYSKGLSVRILRK